MPSTELTELSNTRHILTECLENFSESHRQETISHAVSMLTQAKQDNVIIDISNCLKQLDLVSIAVDNSKKELIKLLEYVDHEITKKSERLLYSDFPDTSTNNNWREILTSDWELKQRHTEVSDELRKSVTGHINKYSDFKYPALEIGPGSGEWTNTLSGFDPLYLVEYHESMFELVKQKFNEFYVRRLRFYCNRADPFDFSMLPMGQFGFIFAWNVFDFYRFQSLNKILHSCFTLLRPGGHILFSYNNCEYTTNVISAESEWKSWMNTRLIQLCCDDVGFEFKENSHVGKQYFCTLKKPGELKTVKLQQALGQIITKNT